MNLEVTKSRVQLHNLKYYGRLQQPLQHFLSQRISNFPYYQFFLSKMCSSENIDQVKVMKCYISSYTNSLFVNKHQETPLNIASLMFRNL